MASGNERLVKHVFSRCVPVALCLGPWSHGGLSAQAARQRCVEAGDGAKTVRFLAGIVLLLALLAAPLRAEAAERVALVIGNNAYSGTAALDNPVRDATAIAKSLEKLGFSVLLATDIDRRAAIAAIDEFGRRLTDQATALVYYAGHAVQIGGRNFLLPTDVSVDSERALRYSSIDIQEVVAEMERRAGVSIVILDSCRDNPFLDQLPDRGATRSTQVQRGLGPMQLRGRGAIIAYAASAGAVASDGEGEHSPYTAALLEEIGAPGVEVGLMFRRVSKRVIDATRGQQRPELLVRLVDEVYLNPGEAIAEARPAAETHTVTAPEVKPEAAPVEVAAAGNGKPRGTARAADRFFGQRVIFHPDWAGKAALPRATGFKSAPSRGIGEAASNDTYGTAQPLPLAADVTARITPRGDVDWYRVSVPVAGELRVFAESSPERLDLFARIWNDDHQVVADWQGAGRPGGALDGRYPLPGPGDYWIEMADGRSDAESADPFAFNVDFAAADDPFEPNNAIGAAHPVPLPAKFLATVYPRGDSDWYKVWVGEPGLLSVLAETVPDELDIAIRVWNLDGQVVRDWAVPPRPGGDTLHETELAEPGVYIVETTDSRNDAATVDPFQLSFDFRPVPDAAEPNNSFGAAAAVGPTSAHRIAIFPRGDIDWLSIDIGHSGELRLSATHSPENLDIYMRVWTSEKSVLRDWFGPLRMGGDVDDFADLPGPGRYFVEISDGRSDAASPELFDLALAFTPQPDQYEPNDSAAAAAALTPGGEILFNILPRGDTDWFRVETASAGELAATIDEGPENLDLHYRIWNADRQVIRDWVAPYRKGGLTEGFADLPSAGVYFIEVSDGRSDDRSVGHATLATKFTATDDPLEPNDSYGSARPLTLGAPHRAHILPLGDTDWYLLEAPRSGEFAVTVDEVDPALDIFVRLWNAEAQVIRDWVGPPRPGGVTEAAFAVPGAGIYRLEVSDGRSDARSPNPFRIQVDFR
jgi:hypothetical protein